VLLSKVLGLVPGSPNALNGTFRAAAAQIGLAVGSAHNYFDMTNASDPQYNQVFATEYDGSVAENSCKWGGTESSPNSFNFADCEAVQDFAIAHGMRFRLHNLCWSADNPTWLIDQSWSSEQLATCTDGRGRGVRWE
jgi:GH35 family endo-1,4-beta-xylanase